MKREKTKPKTKDNLERQSATVAANPKDETDYRALDKKHWPKPSAMELATLASRLSRTETFDPQVLVFRALRLYIESYELIRLEYRNSRELDEAELLANCEAPEAEKYPVSFAEAEILLLPQFKGRTGDRAALFRKYLSTILAHKKYRKTHPAEKMAALLENGGEIVVDTFYAPPKIELDEEFKKLRNRIFDRRNYAEFAYDLLTWYRLDRQEVISERMRLNAKKGWAKRRREKKDKTGARPDRAGLRKIVEQSGLT